MKRILASSALVALMAAPLYAQTATDPATPPVDSTAPATMPETAPMNSAPAEAPLGTPAEDNLAETPVTPLPGEAPAATIMPAQVTAEQLQGAPVLDLNGEKIGDISEVVLADDGQISNVVIDVGGFLGIGSKSVAMEFGALQIQQETDSENVEVRVSATEDELKAMPEYQG